MEYYLLTRAPKKHWRDCRRVLVCIIPAESRREALRLAPPEMHVRLEEYQRRAAQVLPKFGAVVSI